MNNTHLNRQEQEVLDILKKAGPKGMNSYAWRTKYVQLPARIFGLKKAGYLITTRRHQNGSVDYILAGERDIAKQIEQPKQQVNMVWDFSGGTARLVPEDQRNSDASEPTQGTLF